LQYKNTQIDNVDIIVDTTLWDREYVNGTEVDTYDSQTYHGKVVHNYNTDIINNKAGVDVNQYSAEFNNMGSYTSSVDKTADEYGVYNNLDYSIGDMVLSGGVRYDDNSMHGSHSTYRVGSSYSVSNNLSVFGSVATGYKNPTMYEMFGADNFGYSGNANLDPETSFNKEIGVSYSKKMTSFSATVYDTDIKDMITYSGSTYINNTTNTSTMEGAEATLKFKLGDFMFTNRYAHIHAVNGTGGWLLRRPHDTFHSMVKYSKGKFYVMPMLTHYGKHADLHPTTYATVHVKERTTVDLKAGYGNLALEVANVFDDDYERPLGYNQGGQQLKLTYSWKF
jgi:vitamin B12 transporter